MSRRYASLAVAFVVVVGFARRAGAQEGAGERTLAAVPIDELIRQAGVSQGEVTSMAVDRADSPWNGAQLSGFVAV